MSIKALIFDLDGTAIPNSPTGMPSKKVIEAVRKAQDVVKVACATGRGTALAKPIVDAFQFTSPCIVSGGSQIIDPISRKPIWQKVLSPQKIREIVVACNDVEYPMESDEDFGVSKKTKEYDSLSEKPILYIVGVGQEDAETIMGKLYSISEISAVPVKAWTAGDVDIHITNIDASKKHALEEWMRIEHVNPEEVMAIGDSSNDIPLLETAGIKIAMGNASEKLKEMAGWVAPTVDEDGLAVAIEKYILQ